MPGGGSALSVDSAATDMRTNLTSPIVPLQPSPLVAGNNQIGRTATSDIIKIESGLSLDPKVDPFF